MRLLPANIARLAVALLAAGLLMLPPPAGRAVASAQRGDGLDQPLLAANICGAGAAGETQFTLAATGDTFPHENIQAAAEAQGYDALFDHVRPFLKAADLAYTNFDGAMLASSPFSGYPAFNYNPKLAAALKNAGVGLVSTANNHIMDRGPEGLDATLAVLQQAGIMQHGTVASGVADQPRPLYLPITLTRDGVSLKLAFLSFSWGTNGIPDPHNQVNLLWQSSDYGAQGGIRQSVLDAVAQARQAADIVIVAAHWGYEYQFYPDAVQIAGAQQLAAAGADVILGAQPHTLQPVDILTNNGRKTLVIYSLANFLASQGAFQAESFSATATIFYVGLTRHADGSASISGYRYLPTIHVDEDTRPAPIPPQGFDDVIAHVRLEMRDPLGVRQLSADPAALGARVEVCPSLALPGGAGPPITGDFAQYFATLAGATAHDPAAALAVFGAPLGPLVQEPAGDCRTSASVLYTERQRLELHPELDWPFRVTGTQLGALIYQQKYRAHDVQRRTNLAGDAIINERFRAFFQAYGGLPVFGYPISAALTENIAGQPTTVQYFERARFELAPGAATEADLLAQVHLGALGREYPGIAAQCPNLSAEARQPLSSSTVQPQPAALTNPLSHAPSPAAAASVAQPGGTAWWMWLLIGLTSVLLLGTIAWGLQLRVDMRARQTRAARRRRAAEAPGRAVYAQDDEELLRRLLGG